MTSTDRYHQAARDGYLDLLRDSTKRDCNTSDEDGMSPTLWAAYYGHLDALRLLVGRGGDPDKCDHYGNTALHCAAMNGHINCVSFLINFGVNLWALDNDLHTAQELAGMRGYDDVLRLLDTAVARQAALNQKHVRTMKERALIDADKRCKQLEKLQKKAVKKAEKEDKKLQRERKRMEVTGSEENTAPSQHRDSVSAHIGLQSIRRDSRLLYNASPAFSTLVNTGGGGTTKKIATGVNKRIQKIKKEVEPEFKVSTAVESDGKRSVRSLSGLRRDSQIMYVPKYDAQGGIVSQSSTGVAQRGRLQDVFSARHAGSISVGPGGYGVKDRSGLASTGFGSLSGNVIGGRGRLTRAASEPDFSFHLNGNHLDVADDDDTSSSLLREPPSIFDRPGFGNVAFRQQSLTGALLSITSDEERDSARISDRGSDPGSDRRSGSDSIGSAGSLARRNRNNIPHSRGKLGSAHGGSSSGATTSSHQQWTDDDANLDDEEMDESMSALEMFLTVHNLRGCLPYLRREQIDLEALLLLTESDLKEVGIPLGSRKKLMEAIHKRKEALNEAGEVYDSRL